MLMCGLQKKKKTFNTNFPEVGGKFQIYAL